ERAKDRAKENEMETAHLEAAVEEIDRELEQKSTYQAKLETGHAQLSAIDKEVTERETRLGKLRRERESLENKKAKLTEFEERLAGTARDLERWGSLATQHGARLSEYERLLSQRQTITDGYSQFSDAKKLSGELDRKLRLVTTLTEQKHRLEMSITRAGQALLKEHAVAQSRIGELEKTAQQLPSLRHEQKQLAIQLQKLAEPEEGLRQEKKACQELQSRVNHLESRKAQLEGEINELAEKLDLLETKKGTQCPLCETELKAEGIKIIETKYVADRQAKLKALEQNRAELTQRTSELSRLESRLNQEGTSLKTRANVLSKEITDAEEAGGRAKTAAESLAGIEKSLAGKDFALAEQRALAGLEGELAALGYDASRHEAARQRLASLEQYEGQQRKLEEAERLLGQEKEAVSRAETAAQELRHSLKTEGQKRRSLGEELGRLPALVTELGRAEEEYQSSKSGQKRAQEVIGGMKARLERLGELETKRREKAKLLSQAQKQEKIYRDLAQAFGKKGIQALLIESALPEIEVEANKLLARMTDNRMHIKIETQRETKAGSVVETLEIKISDELGTRNYEMYSGGEAFRINFAIRIALSKLLARRAGAPLPTLVIDEGFGTQDSSGIEKLKEAINSIQDDFEKILVITHIEELRDAFPTRINVVKTQSGSTLEVS
ncbi:hypothetical protein ACFLTJ_03795, partial [Chloroflexota bacterium]